MPTLIIDKAWDDGTTINAQLHEIVRYQGDNLTFMYIVSSTKAGKSLSQIKADIAGQIRAQRQARIAQFPPTTDVDLGETIDV